MTARLVLFTVVLFFLVRTEIKAQVTTFDIDSSKFKRELLPTLDSIYFADQSLRLELIELIKTKAPKEKIESAEKALRHSDKLNLVKVKMILAEYGWLGPQDVGFNGSQAIFLVIQHADLPTQQQYLPIVRQAEKEGKILSSNLAILEDRVAMKEGKKQIYGSQGFKDRTTGKSYIYPTIDVDNLDRRRLSMGMPPMKEYVPNWNLDEYKNMLPEIEKKAKEQNLAL